jgi:alpha-beta hydrolase superfamily lysophospholipase
MGGAVVMVAMTEPDAPQVTGVILAAPAVWTRETMPWYQRAALWFTAHTMPGLRLTGKGLNIKPSDNRAMLRALGRDPKVIKKTRVEALYGVTNLMDKAFERSAQFKGKTLLLYGKNDDIIPKEPTYEMMQRLQKDGDCQILIYPNGYHMLLRDLQAKIVWNDISAWIGDKPFASGADQVGIKLLERITPSS